MESFGSFYASVFSFIENTYGGDLLAKVKSKTNAGVVDRIMADSHKRGYADDRTGNKIIAMLRLNP
jgi:hypothetical protein